ncbi:hypothetical protein [Acidihalobacter prosperus]
MLVIHAKSSRERNSDNEFSNIQALLCVCICNAECAEQRASGVPVAEAPPEVGFGKSFWRSGGAYAAAMVDIHRLWA